jgi:predicted PurR-regulated permease PerM
MSTFYSIGLWIVGLEAGLPIGIIAGLLVVVPYLGASIGILLSTMTALVQFGSFMQIWPVWAVFLAGQILEGNFITPKLVGDRIGLHPVMVIFALLAFGQLLGFAGLLLALPLAAIFQVGFTHFWRHYRASALYQKP